MRFQDKVAVVTGAAKGIGEAAAIAFAREGASVAIVDIDRIAGENVATRIRDKGGKVLLSPTDLSKEAEIQGMVDSVIAQWGHLDILVNNAGIYFQGDITATSLEIWNQVMNINLTGAFLCTKYCVPMMMKRGKGVVINVASEAGLVGIVGQVVYNVSKGGMVSLTRSCAVDLAKHGIRVNCVCPGTTDTPLVQEAVNRAPDPAAARSALERVRPLNRLGTPEEIASAILYLASDEVSYATGAVLSIDGGYTTQ